MSNYWTCAVPNCKICVLSPVERATMKQDVLKGIALLDEIAPQCWRQLVHLDRLDIANSENCILGQIYGDWGNEEAQPMRDAYREANLNKVFEIGIYTETWKDVLSS